MPSTRLQTNGEEAMTMKAMKMSEKLRLFRMDIRFQQQQNPSVRQNKINRILHIISDET